MIVSHRSPEESLMQDINKGIYWKDDLIVIGDHTEMKQRSGTSGLPLWSLWEYGFYSTGRNPFYKGSRGIQYGFVPRAGFGFYGEGFSSKVRPGKVMPRFRRKYYGMAKKPHPAQVPTRFLQQAALAAKDELKIRLGALFGAD